MGQKYISVKDTAKIVRQDIKKNWPHIKFSVISKSYSGGASISILWTDGPTNEDVKQFVSKFEGSHFDAMQDLKECATLMGYLLFYSIINRQVQKAMWLKW